MTNILRWTCLIIGLSALLSIVSVRDAEGQILGPILSRMDKHNKALQSLTAGVTMVKRDATLGVSDTSVGTTSYVAESPSQLLLLRLDWKTENGKPLQRSMAVTGDSYEMFDAKLGQVIVGKIKKAGGGGPSGPNILALMNMPKDKLKANYDVIYIGEEQIVGSTQTWHLKLTPKVKSDFKFAELWVDGDGMPRQAKVTGQNNDSTEVLLSQIQKNITLKKVMFKLNYDKNKVKIIQG